MALQAAKHAMLEGENHLLNAYYAAKDSSKRQKHMDAARNFFLASRRQLAGVMHKDAEFRKALHRLQKLCLRWNAMI